MDDEQYWMQRLDEYLHHREHVEGKAKGTVEDDKAIVGQWITFALEQPTDPAARDTPLLDYWVTEVKDLVPGAQEGYRAHVRQWWRWNEEGSVVAETAADVDPASLVLSARLARMVTEFRRSTGYPHAGDEENLRARERFEAILRGLPTMLHSERQLLKEVWRMQSGADYGGPGQIVQLSSFVDRLNEAGWERLRGQISALCFSGEALADRLETAVGEVDGMGWTTATRLAAISDPQRVIPNYSLYNAGRWAGKLDNLQMLTDEGLLEDEHMARAEQVLRDHPRNRPSGRAVVESNDLLLEILRPHFTDGDSADTWGMRTFLYWLSERCLERQGSTRDADARGDGELDLPTLVTEFRAQSRYPGEDDHEHLMARERHESTLRSLKEMGFENRQSLKSVWAKSNQNYGWCGQQPSLDRAVNNSTEESWPRIRDSLAELCFGAGELEGRIDDAVSSVGGLGYLAATKLPAVCHPEDFVPVYVLRRTSDEGHALGKLDMIELLVELGLLDTEQAGEADAIVALHEEHDDCGAVVIGSNDLLLAALGPHFTDDGAIDTWGIASFLYWLTWEYRDQDSTEHWVDEAALEALSGELLCEVDFLEEVVGLLEDKGQVILYGPPGTGKTYFAQRLARTLTGIQDDEWYDENGPYSLVQFHPAYSYEDFFEGFRPQVKDGQMTYKLTAGPLVRLAERAAEHPDELHVMVIDEINRANLPRVLGELLYLLEYRDEWTQTQYRPDDGFELPSNLWFIGTMNTADRSIALIDAAMRRRFHFVPFFPNRPPTEDLLQRWTQQHAPDQTWVTALLDEVNGELEEALGGDHLLIGPSHFMKSDLDKATVRRIWQYNIEPLIEDQLFGQHEAIERFRFDKVMQRHGPDADGRRTGDSSTGDGSAGTEGPPGDGAGDLADGPDDG
ncbi:MAG: AAA family ATPase [Acidimicrobiaceae bacterium]|nr:AAA family ATPase [Acidimicrobiaceae bacterium]MCY3608487.1 AAA family ATPase [Acidimicrobiaceae bacterium]